MQLNLSAVFFLGAALAFSARPASGASVQYGSKNVSLAQSFQQPMQCVLDQLKQKQYVPKDVGCFGSRPHNASAHPTGHACDVDQTDRNVTRLNGKVSKDDQIQVAQDCKAVSGCQWPKSPDCGHFEALGKEGYVAAGAGSHYYPGYESHPVRRRRR